jgi:hypothetical protein
MGPDCDALFIGCCAADARHPRQASGDSPPGLSSIRDCPEHRPAPVATA